MLKVRFSSEIYTCVEMIDVCVVCVVRGILALLLKRSVCVVCVVWEILKRKRCVEGGFVCDVCVVRVICERERCVEGGVGCVGCVVRL